MVLRGISLKVGGAETAVVAGHNGAGKSTLLKTIFGLVSPRRGSIRFNEREISRRNTVERLEQGIGYSPQGAQVFPTMTVRENLELGGYTLSSRSELREGLDRVCALFPSLYERKELKAGSLSGGERQMLSMGIALMRSPRLYLLDEPSGGLAPKYVERLFEAIGAVRKMYGTSILLVEQNLKAALDVADRVYVLAGGRIAFSGTPGQLRHAEELGTFLQTG